jgi:hypothetical protein
MDFCTIRSAMIQLVHTNCAHMLFGSRCHNWECLEISKIISQSVYAVGSAVQDWHKIKVLVVRTYRPIRSVYQYQAAMFSRAITKTAWHRIRENQMFDTLTELPTLPQCQR